MQLRGVQVAVVGLVAASFEEQPTNEDTLTLLEEMNIPVMRVRWGEAIPAILEGA